MAGCGEGEQVRRHRHAETGHSDGLHGLGGGAREERGPDIARAKHDRAVRGEHDDGAVVHTFDEAPVGRGGEAARATGPVHGVTSDRLSAGVARRDVPEPRGRRGGLVHEYVLSHDVTGFG
jgi:hypothetical protein